MTIDQGIQVLVVLFPNHVKGSWEDYLYSDIHRKVAETAKGCGFNVLDLLEVYRQHEPFSIFALKNDIHPGILGHQLAAEAIKNKILSMNPDWISEKDQAKKISLQNPSPVLPHAPN